MNFFRRSEDYLAGFRRIRIAVRTVTYMLDGHMLHEIIWVIAATQPFGMDDRGRGVIHSEMPQQARGACAGFSCGSLTAKKNATGVVSRYRSRGNSVARSSGGAV